jgi:hypothetical protein
MLDAFGRRSHRPLRSHLLKHSAWTRSSFASHAGGASVRLALGRAHETLAASGGQYELGFSSFEAYARERCERTGRWAADTRALSRKLEFLPKTREALRSGAIGWSTAELLARHVTADSEFAWLEKARSVTVRELRALVAQDSAGTSWREVLLRKRRQAQGSRVRVEGVRHRRGARSRRRARALPRPLELVRVFGGPAAHGGSQRCVEGHRRRHPRAHAPPRGVAGGGSCGRARTGHGRRPAHEGSLTRAFDSQSVGRSLMKSSGCAWSNERWRSIGVPSGRRSTM